ncbi:AAA family ATPase [Pseudonocardia sp. Cha107L01]|uniref:AAA family ATPase n=1 Tax=Pseudonocardia sp. Cha107L01 TaxID=3457576 RepID=UPI00403E466C
MLGWWGGPVIVWLNGTFGAGKTTTAGELVELLAGARLFDAEEVGYLLRRIPNLPAVGNFQHWPPWRGLVVETARQVLDYVGGTLVIPQTVLVRRYWVEIRDGLAAADIPTRHFLLHADRETLVHRIERDTPGNRRWRLQHLRDYRVALSWLREHAEVVDTTDVTPRDVARAIAVRVAA